MFEACGGEESPFSLWKNVLDAYTGSKIPFSIPLNVLETVEVLRVHFDYR